MPLSSLSSLSHVTLAAPDDPGTGSARDGQALVDGDTALMITRFQAQHIAGRGRRQCSRQLAGARLD
jgi:hypothetical protein